MRQTFITNLILLLALNLLVKPFYILGIEAEIQNRVGPEVFGSYFALINFSFLLNILPDMGTTNWNTRHIAQNSQLLSKHFARIFTLRIVLSGLYLLVVGIIALVLDYNAAQLKMLALLALSQLFAAMIMYLRSNLTGLHLFKHDSIISVLDRLLLVCMMAYLLWSGTVTDFYFNIQWLVWGQVIAYGITFLVALFFVVKKSGALKLRLDKAFSASVLRQSFPYALLIFISMIAYRVDTVMLERMKGEHEAGIYAMSFRFFEAVNMIAYLFAVLLLPLFARMLKEKKEVGDLVNLSFKILFCAIFPIAVAGEFFENHILQLFYLENFVEAAKTFRLLMYASLLFSLQYVFGTLITATGKLKPLIFIAVCGLMVNLLLNFIYIPVGGARAAATNCFITQGAILSAQIGYVLWQFSYPKPLITLFRTIVFCVFVILLAYYFKWYTINAMSLGLTLALFFGSCLLASILTGMLSIRGVLILLKQQKEAR